MIRFRGLFSLPRMLLLFWFVLLFISDFRFERRSVLDSAQGVTSVRVVVEFAVYCLAGGLALKYLMATGWHKTRSIGLDLLMGYGFFAASSGLWSEAPLFSFVRGLQVVFIALVAKASTSIWHFQARQLRRDWRWLWRFYVGFIVLLGISGLAEGIDYDGRFTWVGMHPVAAGGFLGVAALMATSLMSGIRNKFAKGLLLGAAGFSLWLMLLTVTRSALAATAAGLAAFILITTIRRGNRARASWFFASAVAVVAAWWFAEAIFTYLLRGQTIQQFTSLTGRVDLWAYAVELFWVSPLTGFGFGSGRVLLTQAFPWGGTAHNLWVEIALGLGFLGPLIVTAILAWLLRTGWTLNRKIDAFIGACIALSILIAVKSLGAETFSLPSTELTMVALLTAALSSESFEGKRSSPPADQINAEIAVSQRRTQIPYRR